MVKKIHPDTLKGISQRAKLKMLRDKHPIQRGIEVIKRVPIPKVRSSKLIPNSWDDAAT